MDIIDKVRVFLDDNIEISDEKLQLLIDMVEQRLINYTNLRSVPNGLILDVWIPLVLELVEEWQVNTGADQEIARMSEGSNSIEFRSRETSPLVLNNKLNNRIKSYEAQINAYAQFYRR